MLPEKFGKKTFVKIITRDKSQHDYNMYSIKRFSEK
jgi:hypothetical protein